MSLHFRHYTDRNLSSSDFRFGWVFYDKAQPTLDIFFLKHVFVVFWKKNIK